MKITKDKRLKIVIGAGLSSILIIGLLGLCLKGMVSKGLLAEKGILKNGIVKTAEAQEKPAMAWGYDENLNIVKMPAEEAEKRVKSHWAYAQTEGKLDPFMYYGKLPDLDAENPNVMDFVKANWYQFKWKHSKTALYDHEQQVKEGIKYEGFIDVTAVVIRITSGGMQRKGTVYGGVKNYMREGVDFKDIRRFMSPEDLRGFSIMVWDYLDDAKDQDTFLYLPSMRKIRRLAQSGKEDSFGGTDVTYWGLVLRVPGDEDHKLLRTEIVGDELINQVKKEMLTNPIPGLPPAYTEQRIVNFVEALRGHKVYVIESKQKLGFLSWDKRIWWLDPSTFRDFRRLFYDKSGRLVKTYNVSFRRTPQLPERKVFALSEDAHWMRNELTGHRSFFYHPPMCFNAPLPDENFSFAWLQRAH